MTGGLSVLTAFAINKTMIAPQTIVLIFFSMAFITSAGFAVNDYFDRESDAVIKPKRPIPSGALSLKQVVAVSGVLFAVGLVMAAYINWLSFAIIAADSVLLLIYSTLVKTVGESPEPSPSRGDEDRFSQRQAGGLRILVRMCLARAPSTASREAAFAYIEQAKSRSLADLIAFRAYRLPPSRKTHRALVAPAFSGKVE